MSNYTYQAHNYSVIPQPAYSYPAGSHALCVGTSIAYSYPINMQQAEKLREPDVFMPDEKFDGFKTKQFRRLQTLLDRFDGGY